MSGGHSTYVRSYALAAKQAGFAPQVFCVDRKNAVIETDFGTLHCVASPYRPFRQVLAGMHARPLAKAIERSVRGRDEPLLIHSVGVWGITAQRLRHLRPIIIQSSYTTYRDEALSHLRGRGARLRFLWHYAWTMLAVERWERRAYRGANVILVNYESVARLIAQRHRVSARFMPYSAPSAFSDAPVVRENRGVPRLITIARHEPRKGVDVLLHALARVNVPFRARLIGGGPLLEEHRALAARLGLISRVDIAGIVADVRPSLAEADVFVLPSRAEQSGSVAVLEALQAGNAIIATAVDGLLEDLTDGHDALLVQPGDIAQLADAITRVLTDDTLLHHLQTAARATFEQRFSAEAFAAALATIYRELVERRASALRRTRHTLPKRPVG